MIFISGGKFKNTLLNFNKYLKTRPTKTLIKKKLFSWLGKDLINKNCLDLFSGSGSLGIEAISRGCLTSTLVEKDKLNFKLLKDIKDKLSVKNIYIYNMDVNNFIQRFKFKFNKYNIIFIDPPYSINISNLINCINNFIFLLKKSTFIYIESMFNYKLFLNYFYNLSLINFSNFRKLNAVLFQII